MGIHCKHFQHFLRLDSKSEINDINQIPVVNALVYPRDSISGRIALEKANNQVVVKTQEVKRFTLLLSPDHFEFSEAVKITVNQQIAFEGSVEKSVEVLLKWWTKDRDRSMLFGAELTIDVGKKLK